ncbi:MAG: N-acetylneuraminate synthase family protein [Candidatus Omnitrophica bacterium]|nr:N-acetylneuraminate synthase family protein [Candidatus Omnitrophota bacterium]
MRQEIQIRDRVIGQERPLFIMAECGVTCNYDMSITRELIDAVKEAGADAIKLIFWFPDEIMSDKTITYSYETLEGPKSENMHRMLNRLRFTFEQWMEIKSYADRKGVILFSTVNSPSGIEWAEKLGLEAYKLSSWDYNYFPLWRRIAALGKPMLIDTGPVDTLDAAKAIELMQEEGNDQSVLVHCCHADTYEELNMATIPYLRETFQTLAGYSSRDRNPVPDIMAVTLGACVLEKRLTMSRTLPGHHHVLSLEPKEFAEHVRVLRQVQTGIGKPDLIPSKADLHERKRWFRHLTARVPIKKGTVLTPDLLEGMRPEQGISPEYLEYFLWKPAQRDLQENEAIGWNDV